MGPEENAQKIPGHTLMDALPLIASRVPKAQTPGMEHLPAHHFGQIRTSAFQGGCLLRSIGPVSKNCMTQVGEMDPDLMRAAGDDPDLHQ
jgi:hypothetical protein